MSMTLFTRCPCCGYRHDAHSAVGGDGPRLPAPGDAAVCIGCGEVLVFALDFVGLRLRVPTPDEAAEFASDDRITEVRRAWHAATGKPAIDRRASS